MCINKHQRLASETTFLLGLTQVEEMLISAVMPIICIYRLPHGQYGYSGHVINLHQDVLSFASTLKARPTMLAFRLVYMYGGTYVNDVTYVIPQMFHVSIYANDAGLGLTLRPCPRP